MNLQTLNTISAAEKAISRLVEACNNQGSLYREHPRIVAQVSRTGKWCLNAIAALKKTFSTTSTESNGTSST